MWAASDTFGIGPFAIGVRVDPGELGRRVRRLLADYLVDSEAPPPHYSLRFDLREPGDAQGSGSYSLYRGRCLTVRTRRQDRALRALVACLSDHLERREGLVRLRHLAVVGGSGAVIVPPQLLARVEALEWELDGHGLRMADPPFVDIDVDTGELVLAPPTLSVKVSTDEGHAEHDAGTDGPGGAHGRYPIRRWLMMSREPTETLHAREALGLLMPILDRCTEDPIAHVMTAVSRALSGADVSPIWHDRSDRLLQRLLATA